IDRTKYRVFGGDTDPFASDRIVITILPRVQPEPIIYYAGKMASAPDPRYLLIPDTIWPAPLTPPKVKQLSDHPADGEGVWTTAGLPRATPSDMLMAKTFVRPDPARPYAVVGVLLVDMRRVRLHVTGGTVDPGGDRGVKGTGLIPQDEYSKLLVAFNGGFKGPHGGFGMIADGKEYRPLRNGLASLALMKDGSLRMGEWGADLTWSDDMEAVRQNAALLVKDGEITRRVNEGNDTWGYVKVDSTEFITWRSAVGLTKDGNLLVAAGNSLSAATLAKALWAAGAQSAMQLDINSPYVLTSTFFPQPDGSLQAQRFMDSMPDSPGRFLKPQERDFFWVTLR
ncbi:MAG TPA: phosphodiester glycosidase family protein, partial [Tepidiformaceae bacterium]|nr:phosphodiester glycosidase family protein [Tepidiformaceae bacterium]